ncbi:MAG: glycerol-3-phosphate dehydrogenase [Proteobacteria bacterium]|nr:glycerol-3-phosphate dehydrogenase [Pseudomonadota bacterium]
MQTAAISQPLPANVDLLVVGGGINGVGIARDAVGRGLTVALVEQDDLAAHTSSASTKLIHGGLRYLEQYRFALVRKSLQERRLLLGLAPHVIWPMRFVLPHDAHLHPAWFIRLGLFVYDHLAARAGLPASRLVRLGKHPAGMPLDPRYRVAFEYSDAWVDDARLVVLNAMDAAERGASILTRTRCEVAVREGESWRATLVAADGGRTQLVARAMVNATGPWAGQFARDVATLVDPPQMRLVRGSHIIVRRLFDHDYAYIFQTPDQRIVFAIPYERDFTLLGTTEVDVGSDPVPAAISSAEIDYLCELANRYFTRTIAAADVLAHYSGLRPLRTADIADPSKVSRDYSLELDTAGAPLLSVFSGKITTYRRLAEDALQQLAPWLRASGNRAKRQENGEFTAWTHQAPLPGGDLPAGDFTTFLDRMAARYAWLPAALCQRYARAYGTRMVKLLDRADTVAALGEQVLPRLYEREIDYLIEHEFAQSATDILWRRTKLGLHLDASAVEVLEAWLSKHVVRRSSSN